MLNVDMNKDNVIEELAAMQKELRVMKKYLGEAYVRYNNLNTRVNGLKRKLVAERKKVDKVIGG